MKKLLIAVGLLASFAGVGHAELGIFRGYQDKVYEIHYTTAMAAALTSTQTILIDLSDTVNYPHKQTGYIAIDSILLEVDKAAATTLTAKIGVVSAVNTATGTITWINGTLQTLNVSNTAPKFYYNMHPYFINTRVDPVTPVGGVIGATPDGKMPYFSTNDYTRASTIYQTDVALTTSVDTNVFPAVGDIVLDIAKAASLATLRVSVFYHTENR